MYEPKDFKPLAKRTVTGYLSKWENRIGTYAARSGDRQKLQEQFKPHHQMDLPEYAGSLISIDDRQPPFAYAKGKRVWFYVGYDVASYAMIAWVYGKSKEGIITEFYRQLVRNCTEWGVNLPDGLECEMSLNSSFKNTFLKEGYMFQNVRIEPNNARGKIAESRHKPIRYEIEKEMEGWLPRPNAKRESNQAGHDQIPTIPYDKIIDQALGAIEIYNNQPSPQDKKITRWDYFLQKQNPELKPVNWRAFMPYIGYKSTTGCKAGYISLQGKKRAIAENGKICTGEALIERLRQIEGKEIEIYWLDDNDGNVLKALAYHQGRYICEVQEMPRYNRAVIEQTDEDRAVRELQSKYVMTVESFARHRVKEFMPLNVLDNRPKTLNNNFQIRNRKRYETPEPSEVEILEDNHEEEYVHANKLYRKRKRVIKSLRPHSAEFLTPCRND
jgi:hypothetical protein